MRHVTRFEVGGILRCGLALYLRHLPAIGVLTVVLCAPVMLFHSSVFHSSLPYPLSTGAMQLLVSVVFETLLEASLAYFTVRALRFGAPSVGETIVHALRCSPLVFVVVFVVALMVLLGFVAFVAPGIMALAAFFVAVQVATVERQNVGATLRRSLVLTRGHRWPIFGLLCVLFVPYIVVVIALDIAAPGLIWLLSWPERSRKRSSRACGASSPPWPITTCGCSRTAGTRAASRKSSRDPD